MGQRALVIGRHRVPRGSTRDVRLAVSQRYTGEAIHMPIRVVRAKQSGPTVFVAAAVHGDELNGTGVVHDLMFGESLRLVRGTLILIPAVNIFGFENQARYMPDRRDLNRCFPGSGTGSLTSRVAHILMTEVIEHCDYGIDLHTAASGRTNFPNIRGDLSQASVRRLAAAFGCELMVHGKGPSGSLRREATNAGCPTIVLEAGEPNKIEPSILELGVRGIRNALRSLGMASGSAVPPIYQVRVDKATWVRAEMGGILRFHVSAGDLVEASQPIATNASVFGREQNVLVAPVDGIVLGITTLPTVKPGEPVCHLAVPSPKSLRAVRKALDRSPTASRHQRLRDALATNISVSERECEAAGGAAEED